MLWITFPRWSFFIFPVLFICQLALTLKWCFSLWFKNDHKLHGMLFILLVNSFLNLWFIFTKAHFISLFHINVMSSIFTQRLVSTGLRFYCIRQNRILSTHSIWFCFSVRNRMLCHLWICYSVFCRNVAFSLSLLFRSDGREQSC